MLPSPAGLSEFAHRSSILHRCVICLSIRAFFCQYRGNMAVLVSRSLWLGSGGVERDGLRESGTGDFRRFDGGCAGGHFLQGDTAVKEGLAR